jgi:hypothetical protein
MYAYRTTVLVTLQGPAGSMPMTTRSRTRRVVSLVCALGLTSGGVALALGHAAPRVTAMAATALGIGLVWIFADVSEWWKGE